MDELYELFTKSRALYEQGRYLEAENIAKEALTVAEKAYGANHPAVAYNLNLLSLIYYAQGKYAETEPLYKRSLNDFTDHPLVYNLILGGLGYAYMQLGDNSNAIVYFEKLVASTDSGNRDEALFNLGVLYEKLGDKDKSHQAFNQILSSYPNSMYFDIVEEKLAHTETESSS